MKINPLYVLPNMFTAGSIFLGVLSIIYASKNAFEISCWLVLISMVLDGLDGRVARLTKTTSKFGIEFDSLADVIAFGVAPAMILYFAIGSGYERFGALASALFVIFGAIRLARFNVYAGNIDSSYFIGLPIPSAAAFTVLWILMNSKYGIFDDFKYVILISSFLAGVLMVSNVRYPSFKNINLSFRLFVLIVIVLLASIYLYTRETLTALITIYVIYGIFRSICLICKIKIFKNRPEKDK